MTKIKVEIIKDDPIGLVKGDIKNLDVNIADDLVKSKQAKYYKEKTVKID